MKKLLGVTALASILWLSGCVGGRSLRQFYVASTNEGYRVAVDVCSTNYGTVWVSKPFSSPVDATILAQKLNRDMAEDWNK